MTTTKQANLLGYRYWAKVSNDGVIKLTVRGPSGAVFYNFDRGVDVECAGLTGRLVVRLIRWWIT